MTTRQLTTTGVSVQDLRDVVALAVACHPEARTRIEAAAGIVLLRSIAPDPEYLCCFAVESEAEPGRSYAVDAGVGVCNCPDHQRRGVTCKYLWAVRLLGPLARLRAADATLVEAA
jgi:hypothetical protein